MLKFEPFKRYKDKVQLFTFRKRSIYHAQNKEKISGGNQLPVKTENQVKMYLKTLKKILILFSSIFTTKKKNYPFIKFIFKMLNSCYNNKQCYNNITFVLPLFCCFATLVQKYLLGGVLQRSTVLRLLL
jgi:hypothetical protein